jgi:hypothetical protein
MNSKPEGIFLFGCRFSLLNQSMQTKVPAPPEVTNMQAMQPNMVQQVSDLNQTNQATPANGMMIENSVIQLTLYTSKTTKGRKQRYILFLILMKCIFYF